MRLVWKDLFHRTLPALPDNSRTFPIHTKFLGVEGDREWVKWVKCQGVHMIKKMNDLPPKKNPPIHHVNGNVFPGSANPPDRVAP